MADNKQYDLLIKNVRIVRPNADSVLESDIAVKDGRIMPTDPAHHKPQSTARY